MRVRGWCPSVYEPMPSGDGLLVRVKPPGGRLPPAALHALADAADAHGNGIIELTNRGNLQVRGLTEASVSRFTAAMVAVGLADPDPARERQRNIIVMPPYDDALAAELEAVLMGIEILAPKFCVSLGQTDADIVITSLAACPGPSMIFDGTTLPYTPDELRRVVISAAGRRLPRSGTPAAHPAEDLWFLPFGQTNPATLRLLTKKTEVRTTPYRAFYVPGTVSKAIEIVACPGAPSCISGSTSTRDDARFIALLGIKDLHISGCGKGCAYPHAARTLVARGGRYDLVHHGRAGDPPDVAGLTIAEAAALLA